jgi:hypothetical protein
VGFCRVLPSAFSGVVLRRKRGQPCMEWTAPKIFPSAVDCSTARCIAYGSAGCQILSAEGWKVACFLTVQDNIGELETLFNEYGWSCETWIESTRTRD